MIGIINSGIGNVTSVKNCLSTVGLKCIISSDIEDLKPCGGYILPGVGSASALMENLNTRPQLKDFIKEVFFKADKPLLAICLGMQILFETSEEGHVDCLGLIEGHVKKLNENLCNIGWRNLDMTKLKIKQNTSFYFNHSYYVDIADDKNALKAEVGQNNACVAVRVKNTLAVQFHPEKSQRAGSQLIKSHFRPEHA